MERIPIVTSRVWLAEFFARRNRLKRTEIFPIIRGDQLRGRHPKIIVVLYGWGNHMTNREYSDICELLAYHRSFGTEILEMDDLAVLPVSVKFAFGVKDRGNDVQNHE